MITEIEKNICERMDYAQKFINLKLKYIDDSLDTPTFTVPQVKTIFKKINDFSYEYVGEGSHHLTKKTDNIEVRYNFVISQNTVNMYLTLQKNGNFVGPSRSNTASFLRYIAYDNTLVQKINESFGLNSIEDLEDYISDYIILSNEFVDEYNKEFEAGNIIIESK